MKNVCKLFVFFTITFVGCSIISHEPSKKESGIYERAAAEASESEQIMNNGGYG